MNLNFILLAVVHWVFLATSVQAHYDPNTGQFLSRDPLGEKESLNLYSITGNDPINYVDVQGLAKVAIDGSRNFTALGKAILSIAKDDPEAARAILLAAQVQSEITGANVEGLLGNGDAGSVNNVLRAIDNAVGVARRDGREEWKHIAANLSGVSRDFDNGQATQSIWVDSLFAEYAPAIAARAAYATAFNAARRAANDKETAYQNSPGYKLREIGLATADIPMHLGAAVFSGAMATDVTTGAAVTWEGWANWRGWSKGGSLGLAEVAPGERAFAAGMVFLPMGRGGSFADDFVRTAKGGGLYSTIGGKGGMNPAMFSRIQTAFERKSGRVMASNPASELHLGPNRLIEGETLGQNVIALSINLVGL